MVINRWMFSIKLGILEENVIVGANSLKYHSRLTALFSHHLTVNGFPYVSTAGPTRLSNWRATLPGPLACLWLTWWKASWRTCTKCTLCPHWSRWGDWEQAIHVLANPTWWNSLYRLITTNILYTSSNILKWSADLVVLPSSDRVCMEWRTRSSWASLVSWETTAWQMWFTWHWRMKSRNSWWRVLRPCGAYRRSSPCEERSFEFTSPLLKPYSVFDPLPLYLLYPSRQQPNETSEYLKKKKKAKCL